MFSITRLKCFCFNQLFHQKYSKETTSWLHFYVWAYTVSEVYTGRKTCSNECTAGNGCAQKISQPCNNGSGTGCTLQECEEHCFNELQCTHYFRINNGGCILYRSCEITRQAGNAGVTNLLVRRNFYSKICVNEIRLLYHDKVYSEDECSFLQWFRYWIVTSFVEKFEPRTT